MKFRFYKILHCLFDDDHHHHDGEDNESNDDEDNDNIVDGNDNDEYDDKKPHHYQYTNFVYLTVMYIYSHNPTMHNRQKNKDCTRC